MVRDIPSQNDQPGPSAVRELCWSTSALFRFSALTFNAHKIHYNEEWCREVEGHPTPVVHGPLSLISILDYWRDTYGLRNQLLSIQYRAVSPLFAGETYRVYTMSCDASSPVKICKIAAEKNGILCMRAEVLSSSLSAG
ncbi:hypothetical protein XA68_10979 [Ophiocordyceps unilateralis]|uniref:MaoC-like domain-containing protein n=1 Tax=Ophiocordyceps unilateralis TaxID=268505 RepID=A0A2A9PQV2_OPHUN|nr:hypothetical protein XA68_10979 [Ophiocordyceps unilateralis]